LKQSGNSEDGEKCSAYILKIKPRSAEGLDVGYEKHTWKCHNKIPCIPHTNKKKIIERKHRKVKQVL
jgi:hypothetical protein